MCSIQRRVFVVGNGGREHALVWKLMQSPKISHIFVAPGNGGTELLARSVRSESDIQVQNIGHLYSNKEIALFCVKSKIDLVIVGPELYLASGLADELARHQIACFGPVAAASRLESSKSFSKMFMTRHGIPTARYQSFISYEAALAYLDEFCDGDGQHHRRVVIKASGLASGKGVIVPLNKEEAISAVISMLRDGKFGEAGSEIVIEEYLEGEEASILAFCDGHTIVPMPAVQDHKCLLDGDSGPNTGGMGAICPTPLITPDLAERVQREVLLPVIHGLKQENLNYVGVLFAGIMVTIDDIYCLEFNCRFGDPETQVLMPLLSTDLMDIIESCIVGKLSHQPIVFRRNHVAVTVVAATREYPQSSKTPQRIIGMDKVQSCLPSSADGSKLIEFHAGTKLDIDTEQLWTNGGRVYAITGVSPTLNESIKLAYKAIRLTHFDGIQWRNDIAQKYSKRMRIAVLGSTNGSSLQPILDVVTSGKLPVDINIVISNQKDAFILKRSKSFNPVCIPSQNRTRGDFEQDMLDAIEKAGGADLVLCIGFMRILSPLFITHFKNRLINVHPSLLPDFSGLMDLDVHRSVIAAGKQESGCSIHLIDEGVDTGTVIVQKRCAVVENESSESLKLKVQQLEGIALIEAIQLYRQGILPDKVIISSTPSCSAKHITYKDAGVDIEKGYDLVNKLKPICKETRRTGANAKIGGFGGLFDLAAIQYQDPIMVSSTDGVGTKLMLAIECKKHDTVGQDLVAMCVNDILVQGAEPLFFLDYFAIGKLFPDEALIIISGIAKACKASKCALIGGETAEMPGLYRTGDYDLAGFSVGVVERSQLLPKLDQIQEHDVIIGLASSGIHSNGYSLIRYLLAQNNINLNDKPPFETKKTYLFEQLLEPTYLYVEAILPIMKMGLIKAAANITGGGLIENIPRILPNHLYALLDTSKWTCPPIFKWLKQLGNMTPDEVFKTWNAGIGMIIVVSSQNAQEVISMIEQVELAFIPKIIGKISAQTSQEAKVKLIGIEQFF